MPHTRSTPLKLRLPGQRSRGSLFETGGLHAHALESLSKVMALQALRRNVISTFEVVDQGLAARSAIAKNEVALARRAVEANERARGLCPRDNQKRHDELTAERELHLQRLNGAIEDLTRTELKRSDFAGLFEHLNRERPGYLPNPNSWLDKVFDASFRSELEGWTEESLTALGSTTLRYWRGLLDRPRQLGDWLEASRASTHGLVLAIKAARNEALHVGSSGGAGDVLLGEGARALVDVMLEFFGNWYRHSTATTSGPAELVRNVGQRYDSILSHLKTGGAADSIDLAMITAPNSTGFRPRAS